MVGPAWGKAPKWIAEHPALSDFDVRLYCWLAWAASPGVVVRKSNPEMADKFERCIRTIQRSIDRLEQYGALNVTPRRGRRPQTFTVLVSPLGVVDKSVDKRLPQAPLLSVDMTPVSPLRPVDMTLVSPLLLKTRKEQEGAM